MSRVVLVLQLMLEVSHGCNNKVVSWANRGPTIQGQLSNLKIQNLNIKTYRNIILLVVLCGCENWSLTLREERRLMVFRNRVLRRIMGSKRDEVTGEWRKLHNEELNEVYCLMICTA